MKKALFLALATLSFSLAAQAGYHPDGNSFEDRTSREGAGNNGRRHAVCREGDQFLTTVDGDSHQGDHRELFVCHNGRWVAVD